MVSRRDAQQRREELGTMIRNAGASGDLRPGDLIPSVRELAETFGLSVPTVSLELKRLAAAGVVYTVPRVGTYYGSAEPGTAPTYLLVGPDRSRPFGATPHIHRIRRGFEARVAQLGGDSLILPINEAEERLGEGALPVLAGVFDASNLYDPPDLWYRQLGVPHVKFAAATAQPAPSLWPGDTVYFDEVAAGERVANHLYQHGHRDIAFLGLHSSSDSALYRWSALRAQGWRSSLELHGLGDSARLWLPQQVPDSWESEARVAAVTATSLVKTHMPTAIVTANDHALIGLLSALAETGVDPATWPAIVSFDGMIDGDRGLMTSIQLPWEDVGSRAATVLWERHSRRTPPEEGAAEHLVPMMLIPRASSRKAWNQGSLLRTIS